MTTEINVISRTQIIIVDPTSGSVSVINAGPPGPAGTGSGGGGLVLPPGVMMPFATDGAAPSGWLLCNGAVYTNGAYPNLAAVLRNIYGGDGVTTFAVPDLRGKTIIGQNPSAPPLNTFGASGGSLNHNHPLDNNGYAKVSMGGVPGPNNLSLQRVNVAPAWNRTHDNDTALAFGGSSAATGTGAALGGRTADAVNALPPFILMSYIIKT